MISEKDMEDAISVDPEKYVGEKGLRLVARQYSINAVDLRIGPGYNLA